MTDLSDRTDRQLMVTLDTLNATTRLVLDEIYRRRGQSPAAEKARRLSGRPSRPELRVIPGGAS